MIKSGQKKVLRSAVIAAFVIAVYIFGGKQIVKPDPKGLGFFFLVFSGTVFSLITGLALIGITMIRKKHWVGNFLFILTTISNLLTAAICITMQNDNVLLHFLCYCGVGVGLIQLYLLARYYIKINH